MSAEGLTEQAAAGKRVAGGLSEPILPYEQRLASDLRWALSEGSRFFQGQGGVQETLRRIAQRLTELGIPYAVAGGMALFAHGFRRFTEDVDILVTPDDLRRAHEQLPGRGFLPPFARSKNLRDTQTGVRIEFLVAGEYPGDGKPKPVSFPDPRGVCEQRDGIPYVNLATLVELKIASGLTGADRLKDLADVQELIKAVGLGQEFADRLHPYVRDKYRELWAGAQAPVRSYVRLWPLKVADTGPRTFDELIRHFPEAADELRAMQSDGVALDVAGSKPGDHVRLVTTDPDLARKHGMQDESEVW